jgi:hypothetical protein
MVSPHGRGVSSLFPREDHGEQRGERPDGQTSALKPTPPAYYSTVQYSTVGKMLRGVFGSVFFLTSFF